MSAALKNGGQAFPHADHQMTHALGAAAIEGITDTAERDRIYVAVRGQAAQGMTLRDYFAGQALQALCATRDRQTLASDTIAMQSYTLADAMLRAREGGAS